LPGDTTELTWLSGGLTFGSRCRACLEASVSASEIADLGVPAPTR